MTPVLPRSPPRLGIPSPGWLASKRDSALPDETVETWNPAEALGEAEPPPSGSRKSGNASGSLPITLPLSSLPVTLPFLEMVDVELRQLALDNLEIMSQLRSAPPHLAPLRFWNPAFVEHQHPVQFVGKAVSVLLGELIPGSQMFQPLSSLSVSLGPPPSTRI